MAWAKIGNIWFEIFYTRFGLAKCLDFPSKRRRLGVISQFVSGYFTSRIRHPQPGRLTIHNASIFNYFLKIPKEMFWLFSETTLNRPPLCFHLSNKLREVYFFYSKLIPMPINEHCSIKLITMYFHYYVAGSLFSVCF